MEHDVSVLIADMGPGGAQRVVSLLVDQWVRSGLRVALVTLADQTSDFFTADPGVTRISIDGVAESSSFLSGYRANRARIRALRSAIAGSGAPVVVSFVGSMNVLAVLAARSLDVRVVISERNDPSRQSLGRVWDRLRKIHYKKADVVTANSEHALRALERFVPAFKLRLVDNPVASGGERRPAARPSLLFVGRLVHQKAVDVLLEAMPPIVGEFPDVELSIVGAGPMEDELKSQARSLGIESNLRWMGVMPGLDPLWSTSHVFVLPSRHEGTPNALLEALSWGVPSVVSDTSGGALDLIEDGSNGLVVPTEQPEALASAILRLLRDQGAAEELGERGRRAVQHLQADVVARRWLEILQP